jgi:hypothetical protein
VATTLSDTHITVVVDGQENVCDLGEIGKGGSDRAQVRLLHEEERHTRAEEDNACLGIPRKCFALEVLLPEGDIVVGQPVVLQRLDIFGREENIVIAQIWFFGRKL